MHNTTAQRKIDERNNAKKGVALGLVQSMPDGEVHLAFLWLKSQHTTSGSHFRAAELLLNAVWLDKELAAALQDDKHRTYCCAISLFVDKQTRHNRYLQGLVVHKVKKKIVLLLLLLLLMLIARFSIQLHNTSAPQRQDRVPAWSARKTPCCAAGELAWWPTAGTPELDC